MLRMLQPNAIAVATAMASPVRVPALRMAFTFLPLLPAGMSVLHHGGRFLRSQGQVRPCLDIPRPQPDTSRTALFPTKGHRSRPESRDGTEAP